MCVSFSFFLAGHAKVCENGNGASLFFKPTQPGIFFFSTLILTLSNPLLEACHVYLNWSLETTYQPFLRSLTVFLSTYAHTRTHTAKKKRERIRCILVVCFIERTETRGFFLISPLPFVIIIIDFSRSPSPLFHGFYLKSTHAHIHT